MNKRTASDTSKVVIGMRIASLRSKSNKTQEQLASLLSEISSRKTAYSVSLVSSWEQGRRKPLPETIGLLAHIFGVTEEYLLGISDDPDSSEVSDSNQSIELKMSDLGDFDGRPVFVSFANLEHEDQFAIVNADEQKLMMRDGYMAYPHPSIKAVYASEPDYVYFKSLEGRFPLDMNSLLTSKANLFWVEMKTSDRMVRSKYNGWYRRNEDNTALISSIGLVLPFQGLNVTYYAYLKKHHPEYS